MAKIRAHYGRVRPILGRPYVAPGSSWKRRPPSRLLRDHRKLVRSTDVALQANGHRLIDGWRYRYGQSVIYCARCRQYFRVNIAAKTFVVAACQKLDQEEAA